jgi:hypothetical protein
MSPPDLPDEMRGHRDRLGRDIHQPIRTRLHAVDASIDTAALVRQIAKVRLIRAQLAHEALILKGLLRISRHE